MEPDIKKRKKKKYPKLPNGFGQIKEYSGCRRNPFAAFPPSTRRNEKGYYIQEKPIAWCESYLDAFAELSKWHQEQEIRKQYEEDAKKANPYASYTFSQVYTAFYQDKFGGQKKYSKSSKYSLNAAYKNCSVLHDKLFIEIRYEDMQNILDECVLSYSSQELIVTLLHQMYKFADRYDIVEKDYSAYIKINIDDDVEHGIPFTDTEIKKLWKHSGNPTVEFLLIMIYSGYRIEAYRSLTVNLKDKYFQGGIKTRTSKNRIVPIHSGIFELVKKRYKRDGSMLKTTTDNFRKSMYSTLEELGIEKHTPHDCRHTFSSLCEQYKVNENDRRRMLGHSFGADLTNGTYGHRTLEDLRTEIEKIKICY